MGHATATDTPTPPIRSGIPPAGESLPAPLRHGGRDAVLSDGRTWRIPPLSLGQIHGPAAHAMTRVLKTAVMLAEGKVPEVVLMREVAGAVIECVHMALDRNYPTLHLTFEDVGELLDQETSLDPLKHLYDLNGFALELLRRLGITPPQTTPTTEASGKTG